MISAVARVRIEARAQCEPPPQLTVSEFADYEIQVTSGPFQGTQWKTSTAPYQRGIMDAFHEPGVEIVVAMCSSQVGKTSIALNIVGYHMAHDPCPILVVQPTARPMAEEFSKNRLDPLIAASPMLKEAVSRKRSRDSTNTMLNKQFWGGSLSIGGANSAASLAARSVRLLVLDEVDRFPHELPGEGSTIAVALKRTAAFGRRRRVLMISSPTLVDGTVHAWFQRGDQRRFHVPCPACGAMRPYRWQDVRWVDDDPSTARLHCPECDHGCDDLERVNALSAGEWVSKSPGEPTDDSSVVSFHIWEAYSPFSTLASMVRGFLEARKGQKEGDRAEMHAWQNTTLGEPIEPDWGEGVEPNTLYVRRRKFRAPVPGGACLLTAGVDVQDDRLELLVVGWGPGEESWLVDRRVLPGDTSQLEVWDALDERLAHDYRHESEQLLPISATCIDSAGHRTDAVYDFCADRTARRVFAVVGRAGEGRPIMSSPSMKKRTNRCTVPLFVVGVDTAKHIIMGRLRVVEEGPGHVHIPLDNWADEELIAQLTSERWVRRYHRGVVKAAWVKQRRRNEMLDCFVYALGGLRMLNPDLTAIADRLENPDAVAGKQRQQEERREPWIKPTPDGWLRRR